MGDENKYEYSIDVWDDLAREEIISDRKTSCNFSAR
jgi:hypothetical protein